MEKKMPDCFQFGDSVVLLVIQRTWRWMTQYSCENYPVQSWHHKWYTNLFYTSFLLGGRLCIWVPCIPATATKNLSSTGNTSHGSTSSSLTENGSETDGFGASFPRPLKEGCFRVWERQHTPGIETLGPALNFWLMWIFKIALILGWRG